MALDDAAAIIPGTGYVFLNDTTGAAPPATTDAAVAALDLEADTLTTGWNNAGHTSLDDNVTLGRDGGDRTTKGTWQSPSLRETVAPITWTFGFKALQVSNVTFGLYFGGGDFTAPDRFDVPTTPVPQEKALFLVMVDGTTRLPLYLPKVSILGGDPIEADVENFLQFDLAATVLKATGAPLMSWFSANLGTPA